jgi:hypothetical protein
MRKYLEDFRDRIFDLGCRISDDFLIPASAESFLMPGKK